MMWLLAALLLLPALACAKGADTRNAVLVVGDSLSAAHNIPAASGWVNLLQQRVKQQIKPPPAIINASISGETSSGALTRLPGLLQKHRPSVVVIELGGNDALRGLAPAQLRGNLEKMIVASQYKVPLLPFLLEGVALQPNLMQADGLHPTAAAQPKVLDNVWPVLQPLLKPSSQ